MPVAVWRALRQRALDDGVSVQSIVLGLLAGKLERQEPKAKAPAVPAPAVMPPAPEPSPDAKCKHCEHRHSQHAPRCANVGCVCRAFA